VAKHLLHLSSLCVCLWLACQPADAGTTERVSVSSAEAEANGNSKSGSVSADGRFAVFQSGATNLVPGDSNGKWDVFVRDQRTGTTERVNVSSAGQEANNDCPVSGGVCFAPIISADGRFVAFESRASNLVPDDTNGTIDTFVHDRLLGTTERVSVDSAEGQANGADEFFAFGIAISADGRFVAFASTATSLVPGDTNSASDIFVRDRQMGSTEIVSISSAGLQAGGESQEPAISADGRFVTFASAATNLVPGDTNDQADVFVHDRLMGTTERVSVNSAEGQANGGSIRSAISADGRFVAFRSDARNLVPGDTNSADDIFVRDRLAGTTERVSVSSGGGQATGSGTDHPSISADGRIVAFESSAANLVPGDTNGQPDIFVRDQLMGTTERVNLNNADGQASLGGELPAISANGRFVSFYSWDSTLVPDDTNGARDVFLRDRGPERNDVLIDLASAGLWQWLNNASWIQIHAASPRAVAAGNLDGSLTDEAIVSFGSGLWARYNNARWVKLNDNIPTRFVAGDLDGNGSDELIADFGSGNGGGLWVFWNNRTWMKLHSWTSEDLAVGDLDGNGKVELIADFGTHGLWGWFNAANWTVLYGVSPNHIVAGDLDGDGKDDLVADLDTRGLFARYNNAAPWVKLDARLSEALATADLDGNGKAELIADFGSNGLYARFNNTIWRKLHPRLPYRMVATDLDQNGEDDLIAVYGGGLYVRYNNGSAWTKQHAPPIQDLAAGGLD
jgi:Tol biopolymer transport system component